MYLLKTDFELSDKLKNLIIIQYQKKWNSNFFHDLEQKVNPINPLINKEVTWFLKNFNQDLSIQRFEIFTSNLDYRQKTNPHIDINHSVPITPIKSRFNIPLIISNNEIMFWWDHIKFEHLIETEFSYNQTYRSLGIPGNTVQERWQYLGPPSFTEENIYSTCTFINTNLVHALEINSGPRLILSAVINLDLDSLLQ